MKLSALTPFILIGLLGCDRDHGDKFVPQEITCIKNLKQIGLSMKIWSGDNGDMPPWNVSTNKGGTMELCAPDKNGFDKNAALHFQAMRNELGTPFVVLCPQDKSNKRAATFAEINLSNVTYQLRTGTNITEANSKEVLAVCPIEGNTLYCSGEVVEGKKH